MKPSNIDFTELLKKCYIVASPLYKTVDQYKYNGRIVLEYTKSTKNIFVDTDSSPSEEYEDIARDQIRNFFNGETKTITFNLDFNKDLDGLFSEIQKIKDEYFRKTGKSADDLLRKMAQGL